MIVVCYECGRRYEPCDLDDSVSWGQMEWCSSDCYESDKDFHKREGAWFGPVDSPHSFKLEREQESY